MSNIIRPEELTENAFKLIGNEWFLVAAEKDSKVNAMTASWGAFGVLWQKNSAFIFIRESRFTKEFVDSAETFSLSVFNHAEYADMLGYMGKVSGRDENKIEKCGLTVLHDEAECGNNAVKTPYFKEAETVFICRKLYSIPLPLENFADKSIIEKCYSNGDLHTMYAAEILKVINK